MRHFTLTITLLFLSSILMTAQKLGKLNDVRETDFSSYKTPTVLSQKTLVFFPYRQDNANAGAKDEYFSLQIETIIRIKINRNDSIHKVLGLATSDDKALKISSINYYYQDGNSIKTRKIKESGLTTTSDNNKDYIDYSEMLQDSSAIIDIAFRTNSKSKENIHFFLDKNFTYIDFNLSLYVPEIYTYDIESDQCIKTTIKNGLRGPMIGYDPGTGPNKELLSQVLADVFKKEFNTNYKQVYCSVNLFTFEMKRECSQVNTGRELLKLKLNNIKEIK